jgi:putative hemolysin
MKDNTMTKLAYDPDKIQVRLTENQDEIRAAQAIRYKVFYEEYGAQPNEEMLREKRDIDSYDTITDHLIVLDRDLPEGPSQIVGTYRLLRRAVAEKYGQFYTSDEYNIESLLESGRDLLELGRSCVLPDYRTRPVLQKLWEGIAHYVADYNIGLMFGCASLHGTDIDALSWQLSYLYHYHLAPENLRPKAVADRYVDMNIHPKEAIDQRAVFISLPPLIKGYIRLGGYIGDGAVIDRQFNTTDVCIVLPSAQVKEKYVRHYERKTNKIIPAGEKLGSL